MFFDFLGFKKAKSKKEAEIAEQNKMKIIQTVEEYYKRVQKGGVDFHPRYLAIQNFWNLKKEGRLDKFNRLVGVKKHV